MEGADKDEFEELLRPHLGVAARLAFGLLQDRAEAEDAVQEAALKAVVPASSSLPVTTERPAPLAGSAAGLVTLGLLSTQAAWVAQPPAASRT